MKTDRRDAEKLARCYRAGELTAVWVPDAAHEALRDLVRAREAAKKDQLRHRHRLGKFCCATASVPQMQERHGARKYLEWIRVHARFEQPALAHYLHEVEHAAERIVTLEQCIDEAVAQAAPEIRAVIEALPALRGVARMTAATVMCEVGSFTRFASPSQLMGYSGLVPREHSSGNRTQRGAITKTGNAHLRRVLIETAWAYRHRPAVNRQAAQAAKIAGAQPGRHSSGCTNATPRWRLAARTKNQIVTALGTVNYSASCGPSPYTPKRSFKRRPQRSTYEVFLDSSADDSRGPRKGRTLDENSCGTVSGPNPRYFSPRQLPTDHVHAVPTRVYQCDQSSRQRLGCYRPCCPCRKLKAHRREHCAIFLGELQSGRA